MKKTICILTLVLGLTTQAYAMPPQGAQGTQSAEAKFTQMDTDKDGKVNLEEFKALYPTMKSNVFDIIDDNDDNIIDMKEWINFQNEHMSGMKNEKNKKVTTKVPGDAGGRGANQGMQPAETHPGGNMLIMPPAGQ